MIYIDGDKPLESGSYVAYTNGPSPISAERKLLMYMVGQGWSYPMSDQNYRGEIYGYVGPLPVLRLEN